MTPIQAAEDYWHRHRGHRYAAHPLTPSVEKEFNHLVEVITEERARAGWRHVRRGTTYRILGLCHAGMASGQDDATVVIYREGGTCTYRATDPYASLTSDLVYVGTARVQSSTRAILPGDHTILYADTETGHMSIRLLPEFFDGRFE